MSSEVQVIRVEVPAPRLWERVMWWLRDVLTWVVDRIPDASYTADIKTHAGTMHWYVEDRRKTGGQSMIIWPKSGTVEVRNEGHGISTPQQAGEPHKPSPPWNGEPFSV